jgi:hypothetical protein
VSHARTRITLRARSGGDPPKRAEASYAHTNVTSSVPGEGALAQGITPARLRRATHDLRIVRERRGFGPGSHIEWSLPSELLEELEKAAGDEQ